MIASFARRNPYHQMIIWSYAIETTTPHVERLSRCGDLYSKNLREWTKIRSTKQKILCRVYKSKKPRKPTPLFFGTGTHTRIFRCKFWDSGFWRRISKNGMTHYTWIEVGLPTGNVWSLRPTKVKQPPPKYHRSHEVINSGHLYCISLLGKSNFSVFSFISLQWI